MATTWLNSIMPKGEFPNGGTVHISKESVADPVQAKRGVGPSTMAAPESDVPSNDISHSAAKAFYLATLGGARALSLDEQIGNFVYGKEVDLVVLDVGDSALPGHRMGYIRGSGEFSRLWQKLFALMIMGGGREMTATYIMGNVMHSKA